jgi:hypothetical protein
LQGLILKIPKTKQNRAGTVAQVVVHLPSKCETLSSNSSTAKKKKKKKERKIGRKTKVVLYLVSRQLVTFFSF